jgi:hypothetical protein
MAQKASHLQDMVAYQVIKVIDDGQGRLVMSIMESPES